MAGPSSSTARLCRLFYTDCRLYTVRALRDTRPVGTGVERKGCSHDTGGELGCCFATEREYCCRHVAARVHQYSGHAPCHRQTNSRGGDRGVSVYPAPPPPHPTPTNRGISDYLRALTGPCQRPDPFFHPTVQASARAVWLVERTAIKSV